MRTAALIGLLLATGRIPDAAAQVVVLGHPDTGKYIMVANEQSPRVKAMHRANNRQPGGGWKPLLTSTVTGYGAMFCFRCKGSDVRFFTAEGKSTGAEAITTARAQANTAASGTGTTYICGTWNNRNAHLMEALDSSDANPPSSPVRRASDDPTLRREGEGVLIDTFKDEVRERVTCDPNKKPCPPPRKSAGVGVRG